MGCTRWRPSSDFYPVYSYKRDKEYLRRVCIQCKKRKDKERFRNFSDEQRDRSRERAREWHATKRRRDGVPVRNINKAGYGSGRVNQIDKKLLFDPLDKAITTSGVCANELGDSIARIIRKARVERQITLNSADRVCLAIGTHLDMVYTELR